VLRLAFARVRTRGRLVIAGRPQVGPRVRFDLGPGARVVLGDGAVIGAGTRFHVTAGEVRIGAHARLGERCVLVVHERVEIGASARLGDEVVLVDFDHDTSDVERPIRSQGIITAPIHIGERAVLGAAAAVLRGVTIGPDARVGVRAVVTHDVAAGASVEGVPASG
jgi:acetyltransferase-like isoleucine patch superfamily enzyme